MTSRIRAKLNSIAHYWERAIVIHTLNVECMGVASGCGYQEAGVASGSGWNLSVWLYI